MRKFLTGLEVDGVIDLKQNELQNARVQNLATAPANPVEGQQYYNTADHVLYWYNGTEWVDAKGDEIAYGSVTAETSYGQSSSDGTSTSVARADHTHGTPSLTSVSPQDLAPGSIASVGSGTAPAREDHVHALPDFGSVTSQTSFGSSSGNGTATTFARADHTHGTPDHDGAAHASIKLSDLATPTADISLNDYNLTNVADPVDPQDAATKSYVDAVSQGLDVKASVKATTTGAITLSGEQTIDGVSVLAGDRVLVKDQATASTNGIYVVASGAWARSDDADTSAKVTAGMFTFVEQGTVNADSGWVLVTDGPVDLGTTSLSFNQFSGAGQVDAGDGLTKSGNTLNVGGTADRITVGADAVDIASTYVGQSSITTVGTISTGTWEGTEVDVAHGGTGGTTAADARTNFSDTAFALPQKYAETVGGSTSIAVTHDLGTTDVTVSVYQAGAQVECDITLTNANTVTLGFTEAPAADSIRVVIVG